MFEPPSLRLAVGLGDQALETRLRPALDALDDVVVVAQCLAADQLLQVLDTGDVDALLVATHLHRLTDAVLAQLERPSTPLVLLVDDPDDPRWQSRRDPTLAMDADAAAIRHALLAARRGERPLARTRVAPDAVPLLPDDRVAATTPATARVLAVAGGPGSPGRTTIAANLAATLGVSAPTVLVELDLCAPSIVAHLDRDPSRNLCTLVHAVREDPRAWGPALQAELQPLTQVGATADVLCGPPKREMRASVSPGFVERLVGELLAQYRWIVLDVGPEWAGLDAAAANHRAALLLAEQILLVVGADLVGLWHGRVALDQLERQLGVDRHRVDLILNRFDARHHHARADVEWHLGARVIGVVPFEYHAAQRALSAQRLLVDDPAGRASRAIVAVATRLQQGAAPRAVRLAAPRLGRSWWRRLVPGSRAHSMLRGLPATERQPAASVRGGRGPAW